MKNEPLIFEKKGFPIIKIFDNHFEIKAIDYWDFRSFDYSEVKIIKHYNPNDKWWNKFYFQTSWIAQIFSKDDPWILKIKKNNGGEWTYKTTHNPNPEFRKVIELLKMKISS